MVVADYTLSIIALYTSRGLPLVPGYNLPALCQQHPPLACSHLISILHDLTHYLYILAHYTMLILKPTVLGVNLLLLVLLL